MTDKREQILVRMLAVLNSISSGLSAVRNVPMTDPDTRPFLILYDGDEIASPMDPNKGGPPGIRRVTMEPKVVILDADTAAALGSSLNALRVDVAQAILTDTTLLGYTLNNQGVAYGGAEMMVAEGRQTDGAMALTFEITYVLRTTDLA